MESLAVRPIGGYFPLTLVQGKEYYPELIRLNTSRNALEYILILKGYTKVYFPYYTCEVLLEPLIRLNIPYQFYKINPNLEPILDFEVGPTECLLYTNYFGLKDAVLKQLKATIGNLIIDNAQAFFSRPLPYSDTFYSCRKFFGVPDGAYLQINTDDRLILEKDHSADRVGHLTRSIDYGIEHSYADFITNELCLKDNDIKSMSLLTQALLRGINYKECRNKRIENFKYLNDQLFLVNELELFLPEGVAAMMYPLLLLKRDIRSKLIAKKIFVPTYWPNVLKWTGYKTYEHQLARYMVCLPVDHRYSLNDMEYIVNVIKKII
ncbi:hypothetical protein [Pedobacter heparinus]|uniref:hypothetical protein n=1 Tax=Pedobacter heparinus TaxID=984 RepID=UPI00292DA029|nr:hypothetical protein [Pedobacter heparinus]